MSLIQSSPSEATTGRGKHPGRKRARARFLRAFIVVLLIAVIIGVWQFLNATLNSTDPAVAGRPLSNAQRNPMHLYAGFFLPAIATYSLDGGRSWKTLTN